MEFQTYITGILDLRLQLELVTIWVCRVSKGQSTGVALALNQNRRSFLFSSESVTEGHPDKVADQISDAILDDIISQDPKARVDIETLIMKGTAIVTGRVTTTAYAHIPQIIRGV